MNLNLQDKEGNIPKHIMKLSEKDQHEQSWPPVNMTCQKNRLGWGEINAACQETSTYVETCKC